MDPRIWSRLPDHLLERVLSFIPLKTFLSLRSTCKHFNSLLFSPSFITKHSSSSSLSSPFSSFILLSHPHFLKKCPLFNTVLNSWCNTSSLSFPPLLSHSNLLSSANGLLCFSAPKSSSSSFIICNLLSRSLRHLKSPPTCPFDSELLTLVPTPNNNGYKLFMLSNNKALVYDSPNRSWQQYPAGNFVSPIPNHQKAGVYYDGRLFFPTPEPFHVVGFHLETGTWERSRTELPRGLTFARLVSAVGRKLYLIGGVGANGISRSVKVWELGEGGESWVEFETLPEMVCRKFLSVCYHNYEHLYCFWHQGFLCVCCYTWPEILYYKVSRRTWYWLPKCPSLPDKWSCGFRWFSFQPDLYTSV